jgi:hypothetical protein
VEPAIIARCSWHNNVKKLYENVTDLADRIVVLLLSCWVVLVLKTPKIATNDNQNFLSLKELDAFLAILSR